MNAFEEYCFGNDYILRFYRVDHGLICTINESMVAELRTVEAKINQQQAEIEALKDKLYLTKQSLDIVDSWIGKAQEK
jgi:hypothetical protein